MPARPLSIPWVPRAVLSATKGRGAKLTVQLLSSSEVKNEWNHAATPPYAFTAWKGTTLLLLEPILKPRIVSRCLFSHNVVVTSILHTFNDAVEAA